MKFSTFHAKNAQKAVDDLNAGLTRRLRTEDQFNSFVTTVTINANTEVAIANQLKDIGGRKIIPGEWQVIDSAGAVAGAIKRGSTTWTSSRLYLKNDSTLDGQFKVRFLERKRVKEDDIPLVDPASGLTPPSVYVDTGNGFGSTNNKIRIYSNIRLNDTTSAITYATSAASGASFTIGENGIYSITTADGLSSGLAVFGVSLNCAALTTVIYSISYANGLRGYSETMVANKVNTYSITLYLSEDDVIRPHGDGTADRADAGSFFQIIQIRKQ